MRNSKIMGYDYKDLKRAYKKLGVKRGGVVYVAADLAYLGQSAYRDKDETLEAHYRALKDSVGNNGTIVVPTASLSLCNTNIPFNIKKTPSEMGLLSEHIRKKKGSIRSFHPFISETAIGKRAREICLDTARHPYGPETPHARIIEMDALGISIGLHPRITCSTIHHAELMMGAPYRYTKEFIHPVVRGGKVIREPFYMYVWYRNCDLKRNGNKKIFSGFIKKYEIKTAKVGKGLIYSYSLKDFFNSAVDSFKKDIYVWLDHRPKAKPYRK